MENVLARISFFAQFRIAKGVMLQENAKNANKTSYLLKKIQTDSAYDQLRSNAKYKTVWNANNLKKAFVKNVNLSLNLWDLCVIHRRLFVLPALSK